jgi:hypothetical protein
MRRAESLILPQRVRLLVCASFRLSATWWTELLMMASGVRNSCDTSAMNSRCSWRACCSTLSDKAHIEPDWDLAERPAPDYVVDQRIIMRLNFLSASAGQVLLHQKRG